MENKLEAVNGFREPWYAPIDLSAKKAQQALLIFLEMEVLEDRFWVHHMPRHFASFLTVTVES